MSFTGDNEGQFNAFLTRHGHRLIKVNKSAARLCGLSLLSVDALLLKAALDCDLFFLWKKPNLIYSSL